MKRNRKMPKSKKFKPLRIFSKSNIVIVILAALGIQTYPNLTNNQMAKSDSSDYTTDDTSDSATVIENQIANNINSRIPFQINFTNNNIIIKVPKIDIFSFTRNYVPNTLAVLKSIKNTKLPTSAKNVKFLVGDDAQIFSVSAIKKANFSAKEIKEFGTSGTASEITAKTYQNYYQQYIVPKILK